jgi:hypothetical protein
MPVNGLNKTEMNKCTPQCCLPVEMFEDQNLARSRQCLHCDGVPFAPKRDSNGKTHCSSCSCRFDIHLPDYESLQLLSQTSVKCRIHSQCDWKGRLADYASHPQLLPKKTGLSSNRGQSLNLNGTQQILPLSKTQNCSCNNSTQKPVSEAIDLENRLRSFIDRLETKQKLTETLTRAIYFNEYIQDRINDLPKFDSVMKPLPKDSLKIDSAKIQARFDKGNSNSLPRSRKRGVLENKISEQLSIPPDAKAEAVQPTNEQKSQESKTEISQAQNPTGSQIAETMNIPSKWSDGSRSEFLWKFSVTGPSPDNAAVDFVVKSHRFNISIMKQSLSNFGIRKKFSECNSDNFIGLCLRGQEFCQSDDPRATKIGREIWKVKYKKKEY